MDDAGPGSGAPVHDVTVTKANPSATELAHRQHLLLSRDQLTGLGIDREVVARRVDAKTWRTVGPRIVVLTGGPLTREQRWWAGILHAYVPCTQTAEPRVALTGLTAAEAGGLTGFETPTVHIAVRHGREVTGLTHPALRIVVHQTRDLGADDVHPVAQPPRILLPRAVVEAASASARRAPNRTRAILAASVQQRLVRSRDLATYAVSRTTLPGRRLVLETTDDVAGGAHSLPEVQFSRGLRRAGLPEPSRQRRVRRPDGTYYLDADFVDYAVTVEVNGIQHYELLLSEADDVRRFALQLTGRMVVDMSSYAVRHQIERCMLMIAEALSSHGWVPPAKSRMRLASYRARTGWTSPTLLTG